MSTLTHAWRFSRDKRYRKRENATKRTVNLKERSLQHQTFYKSQQANKCLSKSAVLSLQSMYIPTRFHFLHSAYKRAAARTSYLSQCVANRDASRTRETRFKYELNHRLSTRVTSSTFYQRGFCLPFLPIHLKKLTKQKKTKTKTTIIETSSRD